MLQIPLTKTMRCHHLQERESQSSILKIETHDQSGLRAHFFQCSKSPVSLIKRSILHEVLNCMFHNICLF